MSEREEWPDYEFVSIVACDSCGETRPCINAPDPFILEVHPESDESFVKRWWCRKCWQERIDET